MGVVIVPFVLSHLISACAPKVGLVTMSSLVFYESGGAAFAIGDNTARRSYFPADRNVAITIARRLLARGHNIDVGYAQINSGNFAAYGLNAVSALEPCTNLAAGSRILRAFYAEACRRYAPGGAALVHALSAYNTGNGSAGLRYARGVYRTAAELRFERAPRAERR